MASSTWRPGPLGLHLTLARVLLAPRRVARLDCKSLLSVGLLGGILFWLMARNRVFRLLSWNVRGLNDQAKCFAVRAFIRNCKCCVACIQETKIASPSAAKFCSFCGYSLGDFRSMAAAGTRGGIITAWNPSLF